MVGDQQTVQIRLFKKERNKSTEESVILLQNEVEKEKINQIEILFAQSPVPKEQLSMMFESLLSSWNMLYANNKTCLAFYNISLTGSIYLYVTFEAQKNFNGLEIKRIFQTVRDMINQEILLHSNEASPTEDISTNQLDGNDSHLFYEQQVKEQQEMIKKLAAETLRQDETLRALSELQEPADILLLEELTSNQAEDTSVIEESDDRLDQNDNLELLIQQYLAEKEQLERLVVDSQAEKKKRRSQRKHYQKRLNAYESLNHQLDRANVALQKDLEEIKKSLVEKVNDVSAEKNDIIENLNRQLLLQNQEIDQLRLANKDLTEKLKDDTTEKKALVEKMNQEYDRLENELAEKEKDLVVLTASETKNTLEIEFLNEKTYALEKKHEETSDELNKVYLEIEEDTKEKELLERTVASQKEDYWKQETELKKWMDKYQDERSKNEIEIERWRSSYLDLQTESKLLLRQVEAYKSDISMVTQTVDYLEDQFEKLQDNLVRNLPEDTTGKVMDTLEDESRIETDYKKESLIEDLDYYYEYEGKEYSYEEDPYVEYVAKEELSINLTSNQAVDEANIQDLFILAYDSETQEVRLEYKLYKQYRFELNYLEFRWQQVNITQFNNDKNSFLEWCKPYIEELDDFMEDLSKTVKRPIFSKRYVTIDEDMMLRLKAYSAVSSYLETYYLKAASK